MIEVFIHFTFGEAQTSEIAIDPSVPSMGLLLEAIQHSLEYAHMRLSIKSLEALFFLDV